MLRQITKALKLVDDKRLVKSEPSTPAPDKDMTTPSPAPPTPPPAPASSRVSAPPTLTSDYVSGTDGK